MVVWSKGRVSLGTVKETIHTYIRTYIPLHLRVGVSPLMSDESSPPLNCCTQASKGSSEQCFFSMPEFERWKAMTEGTHTWRVKYYKGLGTSTSAEAKQYFSDMDRHCIQFKYIGREDDDAIELVRPHAYTHTYVRTYTHTHCTCNFCIHNDITHAVLCVPVAFTCCTCVL